MIVYCSNFDGEMVKYFISYSKYIFYDSCSCQFGIKRQASIARVGKVRPAKTIYPASWVIFLVLGT